MGWFHGMNHAKDKRDPVAALSENIWPSFVCNGIVADFDREEDDETSAAVNFSYILLYFCSSALLTDGLVSWRAYKRSSIVRTSSTAASLPSFSATLPQ